MKTASDFTVTALYAIFVQNLVFRAGLGMSEAIRVSTKPGVFGKFAAMISGFSVVTGALCNLVDSVRGLENIPVAYRAAIYGGTLVCVYLAVALTARFVFRASDKLMSSLGVAALNSLVFAIPFINGSAAYSFANSVASGLGAGAAFALAAALINCGSRRIKENPEIPETFRGTPAMFFYVAILSLAFTGIDSSPLFV